MLDSNHLKAAIEGSEVGALLQNYRLTPATLLKALDSSWVPKDFLLKAALEIAQCMAKPDGRLIICWPPRHGKSALGTIGGGVWALENMPHNDIILTTYGQSLSNEFGVAIRDMMKAGFERGILSEQLRKDMQAKDRFKTTKGGGMRNVGIGGPIVGTGAHVLLIDDYFKTMEEALSETTRDKVDEWFTGTAYHRLEPGGSIIIIATRWHRDDLVGRILKRQPDRWKVINFPAIAGENDLLGRKPGEALFPERYPLKNLLDIKETIGTTFFQALYQQDPDNDDSRLTNKAWIETVTTLPCDPSHLRYARVWDFGGGKNKENDPTVGGLFAFDMVTRTQYLIDVWRERKSPETIRSTVKEKAVQDGKNCRIWIEQEPGSAGIQLIDQYVREHLKDYKVEGSPTTTNKVVRATHMLASAEQGRLKILKGAWNNAFLDEFDEFPNGKHDDQVDVCAIAYNHMLGQGIDSPVWGTNAGPQTPNPHHLPTPHTGTPPIPETTEEDPADSRGEPLFRRPGMDRISTPPPGLVTGPVWGANRR